MEHIMNVIIKETGSNAVIAQGEENAQVRAFEGNWYFQPETVDMSKLEITARTYTCPYKGTCYWIDLKTSTGNVYPNIGWVYQSPKAGYEFIKDQIGFYARPTNGTVVEKV
jgi:uncharacterized protein (DUF427 family)